MSTRPAVRLQRTLPAPPHRVYRAFLEPDQMRRWMFPADHTIPRAEVDERPGGHYRIWHTDPDGADAGGFECELLELVPDERLVWRWGFAGPERSAGPVYDSLVTVTLRETASGETELTIVHERLDALAAAMPEVAERVQVGWEQALDQLPAVLAS